MMAKRVSAGKTTFLKPESAMKVRGLRFYSALAILEPQVYSVVEQFGAENISLLSGRLVFELLKKLIQSITKATINLEPITL